MKYISSNILISPARPACVSLIFHSIWSILKYLAPGGRIDERDGPFRPFFLSTGGPLIHGSVMKLSVSLSLSLPLSLARDRTNDSERKTRGGRTSAAARGCNLSSFVLFYARIFRRPPLLGRRALAHAPPPPIGSARTVPIRVGPFKSSRPKWAIRRKRPLRPATTTAALPFFYLLRSLPLSTVLWGTSSVKSMERAALLDTIFVLFYIMVGL